MEDWSCKPQLRVLLDHLATIKDTRQSWKVAYPLREVLLLVVCGTIASGDDYEDIVDWGETHGADRVGIGRRKRLGKGSDGHEYCSENSESDAAIHVLLQPAHFICSHSNSAKVPSVALQLQLLH